MSTNISKYITRESRPHIEILGEALEDPGVRQAIEYFIDQSVKEVNDAFGFRKMAGDELIELNGGKIGILEVKGKLLEFVPALFERVKEMKKQ